MSDLDLTRMMIAISFLIGGFGVVLYTGFKGKNPFTTKFIARTGLFAAMSIILYIVPFLQIQLPFFPEFLKLHFDEIPALIAAFAYGPLSGVIIILIKTLVKLPLSHTMCVGELADLIYSIAFILPAALIYKRHRSIKGALVALLVGTVIQILVSSFVTSFLIIDFYIFMMGWPKAAIVAACTKANPNVKSLGWTFFFLVGIPFNAFKDAIVVIVTFILYKRLHKVIDKIGQEKN